MGHLNVVSLADRWGVRYVLSEGLAALAAAGGTTLVGAATTDVWSVTRTRIARLFGRGERQGGDGGGEPDAPSGRVRDDPGSSSEREPSSSDGTAQPFPLPRSGGTQINTAHRGGTQNITQYGSIHVEIADNERCDGN